MHFLKLFFILPFALSALTAAVPKNAVILKTKGKKVLIYLNGRNTKKGDYFQVVNTDGKAKGLIQIQKTGRVKAIGIVKWGKTQKNWLLEPKSEKWAKRRILLKKRKAYRKMLAQKRRKSLRAPASNKTSQSQPPEVKLKEIQAKAAQVSEFLTKKFWRNVTLKELKEKTERYRKH